MPLPINQALNHWTTAAFFTDIANHQQVVDPSQIYLVSNIPNISSWYKTQIHVLPNICGYINLLSTKFNKIEYIGHVVQVENMGSIE